MTSRSALGEGDCLLAGLDEILGGPLVPFHPTLVRVEAAADFRQVGLQEINDLF